MNNEKALNLMSSMCSKKEYCEFDIREKLQKYSLLENEITDIINFLKANKFLDENRFANAYARDKCKFNNWGKFKIYTMLSSKHVSESIIVEALENIPDKEYADVCLGVLVVKSKLLKEPDELLKKNKLIKFAMGKGFSYDIIKIQLSKLKSNP